MELAGFDLAEEEEEEEVVAGCPGVGCCCGVVGVPPSVTAADFLDDGVDLRTLERFPALVQFGQAYLE